MAESSERDSRGLEALARSGRDQEAAKKATEERNARSGRDQEAAKKATEERNARGLAALEKIAAMRAIDRASEVGLAEARLYQKLAEEQVG